MIKMMLGIVLEISAFAMLLLSELWNLPLTFCLFIHINGVYFFTTGLDRHLVKIELRREMCFFFSLIFPIAGMAGMLFYILVLKKIETRIKVPQAEKRPAADHAVPHEGRVFLENDAFGSLQSAFVRRMSSAIPDFETHEYYSEAFPFLLETEYSRLEQTLYARIKELERETGSETDEKKRRLAADLMIEYVDLFHTDRCLREQFLKQAFSIYRDLNVRSGGEKEILEKLIEITFQRNELKACLHYCESMRKVETMHSGTLLRMGECFFRLREFKKLATFAREIVSSPVMAPVVKEIAQMWYRYG
jgi:hypothetical protein